jgi:hypothetical protein
MMRRPAIPPRQHGVLNIGFALGFIALIGCTGVALDVAQLRRQSALQHMASLRASGIVSPHLHAKELE